MPSTKRLAVEALFYAAVLTNLVSRTLRDDVLARLEDARRRIPPERWAAVFVSVALTILDVVVRTLRRPLRRDPSATPG